MFLRPPIPLRAPGAAPFPPTCCKSVIFAIQTCLQALQPSIAPYILQLSGGGHLLYLPEIFFKKEQHCSARPPGPFLPALSRSCPAPGKGAPIVLGISTSDEGQQHPLEMEGMRVTAASPKHQHLPWLWHRRGHRSSGGIGPLPPALHGPPCAGPSPHAARKQRLLNLKQTHCSGEHTIKMCLPP